MSTTTDSTTTISDSYTATSSAKVNNAPLSPSTGLDPTVGPVGDSSDLATRLLGVNFEQIAKNLASYPSRSDLTVSGQYTKTYYMDSTGTDTITVTTVFTKLSTVSLKKVTTITGKTGYDTSLIKTTIYIRNTVMDVVYSLGE